MRKRLLNRKGLAIKEDPKTCHQILYEAYPELNFDYLSKINELEENNEIK